MPKRLKKVITIVLRALFPSALLAIREKGLRKKLGVLFRHELKAHATPKKLSISLSLGVFMALVPIHGLQVALLLLLSVLFRLNRPVAMVGVSISSAPFLPFWIAAGVGVGELLLSASFVSDISGLLRATLPRAVVTWIEQLPFSGMLDGVVQWFFGSLVLAVVCGVVTFVVSYPLLCKICDVDDKNNRNR